MGDRKEKTRKRKMKTECRESLGWVNKKELGYGEGEDNDKGQVTTIKEVKRQG